MAELDALATFADQYLSIIELPNGFPDRLTQAGFFEVDRKYSVDEDGGRVGRLLFQKPDTRFAFSCLVADDGKISDGALLLPRTRENHDQLLAFVQAQPNLKETTEETRFFFASVPEDVSWSLVDSRFWTSKAVGKTGINYTLGPALFDFPDGTKGIALTASRNLSRQDPITDALLAELTGKGSELAKFVLIFSEVATQACPDLEQIVWAAHAYGYNGDIGEGATSFSLDGGNGPNPRSEDITSGFHVNCDSDYAFEFALTFSLDERLNEDVIQGALFSHLGITQSALGGGIAKLEKDGVTYLVRHTVTSALFGNHAFLLQR